MRPQLARFGATSIHDLVLVDPTADFGEELLRSLQPEFPDERASLRLFRLDVDADFIHRPTTRSRTLIIVLASRAAPVGVATRRSLPTDDLDRLPQPALNVALAAEQAALVIDPVPG